jgi:hypothetical protein
MFANGIRCVESYFKEFWLYGDSRIEAVCIATENESSRNIWRSLANIPSRLLEAKCYSTRTTLFSLVDLLVSAKKFLRSADVEAIWHIRNQEIIDSSCLIGSMWMMGRMVLVCCFPRTSRASG